jgi:hypothetical protein
VERTLEETVLERMDELFQGALFLSGGDVDQAADRVERVAALAFERYAHAPMSEADPAALDRLLVETALESPLPSEPEAAAPPVGPLDIDEVSTDAVLRAARAVPIAPRSALWLVLIRRWSYRAAAEALGTDVDGLRALLGWRDRFTAVAFGRGTAGGSLDAAGAR